MKINILIEELRESLRKTQFSMDIIHAALENDSHVMTGAEKERLETALKSHVSLFDELWKCIETFKVRELCFKRLALKEEG